MGKNGGARPGAGRKPKADEVALIERLSPLDDIALDALKQGVKAGEFPFIKMFMEYRFGKPKETINATVEGSMVWKELKTYVKNGSDSKTDGGA